MYLFCLKKTPKYANPFGFGPCRQSQLKKRIGGKRRLA
jgi:hypothetical protein